MSSLEDSLIDGPGSPSHASSPVSSLEDLSATRESGLGEEGGTSSWAPREAEADAIDDDEDGEEDEELMEEFR